MNGKINSLKRDHSQIGNSILGVDLMLGGGGGGEGGGRGGRGYNGVISICNI